MQRSSELQKTGCADKLQHERLLVKGTPEQHLLMLKFKTVEINASLNEDVDLGEVAEVATRTLAAENELRVLVPTEGGLPVLVQAEAKAEVDRHLSLNNDHLT